MQKRLYVIIVAVVTVLLMAGCGKKENVSEQKQADIMEQEEKKEPEKEEPDKEEPDKKEVEVEIEIKDHGTIKLALDAEQAPITVDNFVTLAKDGFYDGLTFHRIIKDFMMQGGDPLGTGTGGSKTNIKGEFSNNGVDNTLSHTKGAISMARSQDMDSASSQFFIVHKDSLFLDKDYAVFGYVTEGMDIVDEICNTAVPVDSNGSISPEEQPVITSVKVKE